MMETFLVLLTYDPLILKRLIAKVQMELLPLPLYTTFHAILFVRCRFNVTSDRISC